MAGPGSADARVALVTGGSRGVGAATATRLAAAGYDVVLTYNNKARRAEDVVSGIRGLGRRALAVQCDITSAADRQRLVDQVASWAGSLDLLVLNASGGLERARLLEDPAFPMRLNRDSQVAVVDALLGRLHPGADILLVTSHWAHLYGRIRQLPSYEAVAESKHAGEQALRAMMPALRARGVRLLVISGDLIEGSITARLLERRSRGTTEKRREQVGVLVTVDDLAVAMVDAAGDPGWPSGHVVVVGGSLERLVPHWHPSPAARGHRSVTHVL